MLGLPECARKDESFAQFGKPIEKDDLAFLAGNGLKAAAHRASHCMGWIWRQWLLGTSRSLLRKRVEPFVDRGLDLRERSRSYDYLAIHDLFLLHCAIFVCGDAQIRKVAERIADADGDKGQKPLDNGELYAAAWCGMIKHWILGVGRKAEQQSELIWKAYRDRGVLAAPKSLVLPWLKQGWTAFVKSQQKDFEKLWSRARKDGWTVKSEDSTEIVVTSERYQIEHQWCWAHCGLALLAHRKGAEIATDPFWLPSVALDDAVASGRRTQGEHPGQLRMF